MFANKFGRCTITTQWHKLCLFTARVCVSLVLSRNFPDIEADDFIQLRRFYGQTSFARKASNTRDLCTRSASSILLFFHPRTKRNSSRYFEREINFSQRIVKYVRRTACRFQRVKLFNWFLAVAPYRWFRCTISNVPRRARCILRERHIYRNVVYLSLSSKVI